jgi:BNR repeat-like domain
MILRSKLRMALACAAICAIRVAFGALQSMAEESKSLKEQLAIERYVSIDNVCAWPNLTKLPDGSIAAIIFGKPSHGQVAGDIECWVSTDGLFWEKRGKPAPNDPNTNRMNVAAGLAPNGDLLVLCSGWTNEKQPERPKQAAFRDDIIQAWVCRSQDGGRTWKQHKSFLPPDDGWTEYVPFGDICVGEQASLHVSCYGGEFVDPSLSTKTKGYRSWHFRSDDDGQTWKRTSIIGEKHNETTLLSIGGKRWLAAARIEAMDVFLSEDDGQSWQLPVRATDRNEINGHLAKLKDGRILLTYGVRVKGRFGVAAKLSDDEGQTWGEPLTLVDDLVAYDCGYPSSLQREDNRIVTAFYASGSSNHSRYHMGTAIWSAPPK